MIEEWQTYCPRCQAVVLGRKEVPNHLLHMFLTLFLAGLWLIPWIVISIEASGRKYRCPYCGTEGINHGSQQRTELSIEQKTRRRKENTILLIVLLIIPVLGLGTCSIANRCAANAPVVQPVKQ